MSSTYSDIFGGSSSSTTDLGPRLTAIKNTPINGDVIFSIKSDNTITSFQVSSYGKSLLNVENLDGLLALIEQGDSAVSVVDSGVGVVEIKVDNQLVAKWSSIGLTFEPNKILYIDTIMSANGPVQFFSNVSPVINTLNFGTNSERWDNIFSNTTDTAIIKNSSGFITFDSLMKTNAGLLINNGIEPWAGSTQNVGSIQNKFDNGFFNELYGNLHTNRIYNTNITTDYLNYNVLRDGVTSYHYLRSEYGNTDTNVNNLFIGSTGNAGIVFIGNTYNGVDTEYIRNWYDGGYIYGARLSNRLLDVECRNIVPTTASIYNLGHTSRRFLDVYSINAPTHGSDLKLKENIIESSLGLEFINKLNPVEYKWKESQSDRIHQGFIAQEVRDVLGHTNNKNKYGMYVYSPASSREVQIDGKTETITEEESFNLRYTEFISPMCKAIQELNNKIENLENNTLVQGDTVILNQTSTQQSSSSNSNNKKLEKKLDEIIGRVFTLENKGVIEEESEGDFSIVDNLQNRVHSLEMLCNKLEKQNKKLTSAVNKLLKSQ